jgi:AcrR family transcriptional regulator
MERVRTRPRVYGGRSTEQRQADRRRQLIDAAIEIWGEQGWSAVTMRGVCARAGLIDRYFYESFADRAALLVAVWDQQRDELIAKLVAVLTQPIENPIAQLRAAIATLVHDVATDPRRARILFGEHTGNDALERRHVDALQQFTDLLIQLGRPFLRPGANENGLRMSALIGIGGFVELITAWRGGVVQADAEEIIDHAAEVGAVLAARYLADDS